jgi:catechol 2,3-dioxygenase-like lactoylglutathione lyase family enzyme
MTTATPLVTGTDFISFSTKDFAAAKAFYADTLGLECSAEYGHAPGGEFETGGLTIQVIDAASIGREHVPHAFPLALHVEDVAAARTELESRGVRFFDTIDSGVCHMAIFADPDGNMLMLHNRYAPRG